MWMQAWSWLEGKAWSLARFVESGGSVIIELDVVRVRQTGSRAKSSSLSLARDSKKAHVKAQRFGLGELGLVIVQRTRQRGQCSCPRPHACAQAKNMLSSLSESKDLRDTGETTRTRRELTKVVVVLDGVYGQGMSAGLVTGPC